MMKTLLIVLLLFPLLSLAQKQDKLYYFMTKDSLMGVRNGRGAVIITPKYSYWLNGKDDGELIKEELIIFASSERNNNKISQSWGDAYNRKGKLLYHPLSWENGPDYFVEERARCVENNKVGFVNRQGTIVIKPQWDWVSQYNYGYAFACNGCRLDRTKDREHPSIIYPAGVDTCWINKNGERMALLEARQNEKDQKTSNRFLPYPFRYSAKEQKLVDSFNNAEIISLIHYANYYSILEGKETRLQFEITERPSSSSDYYIIQPYQWSNGYYYSADQLIFEVNKKGEWYYKDDIQGRKPFGAWVKNELKRCEEFFQEHPDAPYKFDTKKGKD